MTNKRKLQVILSLLDRLDELLDEQTLIFFEERPYLWEKAEIKKARENLDGIKKENSMATLTVLNTLEKLLNFSEKGVKQQYDNPDKNNTDLALHFDSFCSFNVDLPDSGRVKYGRSTVSKNT